ncbi:hypothetical protein GCM10022403_039010 [Streptomyces coacervatus]|uniref:Integral membrane protein n=1 Tax=Streptomyces coacervatus TaxID=647381 RepID=A0ABP7HS49_9ACTN|nr:hypothetical protein [Streptomyces coacervatus]MDF2270692.1 hypothetical protein [Streptomyces coacervatus]
MTDPDWQNIPPIPPADSPDLDSPILVGHGGSGNRHNLGVGGWFRSLYRAPDFASQNYAFRALVYHEAIERKPGDAENDVLIDLAYDAAVTRLASQTSAFESIRTRASGILSVAALVTSFSAGLGLVHTDPAKGKLLPGWAPWALLGILLMLGVCAILVMLPTRQWNHGPSARKIMDSWVRRTPPERAKARLVAVLVEAQNRNSWELRRRAISYRVAVVLLLSEVLTLVAAVAQSTAT